MANTSPNFTGLMSTWQPWRLAIWAKRHEGGETYDVVMNHLQTLERNADFVAEAIVVLMADR